MWQPRCIIFKISSISLHLSSRSRVDKPRCIYLQFILNMSPRRVRTASTKRHPSRCSRAGTLNKILFKGCSGGNSLNKIWFKDFVVCDPTRCKPFSRIGRPLNKVLFKERPLYSVRGRKKEPLNKTLFKDDPLEQEGPTLEQLEGSHIFRDPPGARKGHVLARQGRRLGARTLDPSSHH